MTRSMPALQLFTLREAVDRDYIGTLQQIAALGYRAVEVVHLGGMTPAAFREQLDALGLSAVAMHVPYQQLKDDIQQVIETAKGIGAAYVVCPWLVPEMRTSADSYREVARTLNAAGQACKDAGLQVCYHHHDFEFEQHDGKTGFDILIEDTDPTRVQFEIDVYWAAFAGIDPVGLLHSLSGRVPLVHLKDMAADESRTFAEVGHGQLDIPGILAACDEIGVEWRIVEQDRSSRDPMESVQMSIEYLRELGRA